MISGNENITTNNKDMVCEAKFNSEDALEDFIKNVIAKELSINVAEVDVDQSFIELGVTSMMSLSIRSSIERKIGLSVPSTLLFNYNTVKNISSQLFLMVNNEEEESDDTVFYSDLEDKEYDHYTEDELFELLMNELGDEEDAC